MKKKNVYYSLCKKSASQGLLSLPKYAYLVQLILIFDKLCEMLDLSSAHACRVEIVNIICTQIMSMFYVMVLTNGFKDKCKEFANKLRNRKRIAFAKMSSFVTGSDKVSR